MKNLNQIERIKIKLRLAKNTDTFFEVFGADCHKYKLASPMQEEELIAFEKKYQITLPKGYKDFLTQIGTGFGDLYNEKNKVIIEKEGAGPEIGLKKLGEYLQHHNPTYLQKSVVFNENIKESEWEELTDKFYEENKDTSWEKAYAGILIIGEAGCSGFMGLVLNGKNKGKILYGNMEEEYLPLFVKQDNFLDWYENWLDEMILGRSIEIRGNNTFSEEELINRYKIEKKQNISHEEDHYQKYVSLRYIKFHPCISKNLLSFLHKIYKEEKNENKKLYLLNILVKFDYENMKGNLEKLSLEKPIEFLKILHLYQPKKTNDWIEKIKLLYNADGVDKQIKEYIYYVSTKDIPSKATYVLSE